MYNIRQWLSEKIRANPTLCLDIEILICYVLKIEDRAQLIFESDTKITETQIHQLNQYLNMRLSGCPLAYIIKKKEFWSLDFIVGTEVLIPRPETETLIEATLDFIINHLSKERKHIKILDLGTGSGCIIITLIKELINKGVCVEAVGVDISGTAIEIAKQNIKYHNLVQYCTFIRSNWFDQLDQNRKFDIIVSNPPYISIDEWKNLSDNIKSYEPIIALTDGYDGLKHYRSIIKALPRFLNKNSAAILECGYKQKDSILKLLTKVPALKLIEIRKDIHAHDRVIVLGN